MRGRTLLAQLIAVALTFLACASPPRPRAGAATHDPSTRYRVGDYVVYRFSGTYTPAPAELREEVVAQRGLQLEISVVVRRGDEVRRWIQVVTDTPENERRNVVDALYELRDGNRVPLANPGNADLYRLYAWTYITPEGRPSDVRHERVVESFAGGRYECDAVEGRNVWHAREVTFRTVDCPSFLWTHGPAEFVAVGTPSDVATGASAPGEVIYRVEVVEAGHSASPHAP